MDSLYLLQFACLIFMLINALILGISRLHVQWLNKRYEQSRWMIFAAMIGLGIQYALQMYFGFRAMGEDIGTIINLLVYTPCFTLIAMGIYNVETTESNRKKINLVCSSFFAAIIAVLGLSFYLKDGWHIGPWIYVLLTLFMGNVVYCIYMIVVQIRKRRKMLEMMAATDMLPYVRYTHAGVLLLFFNALVIPFAMLSTTLLYIVGPFGLITVIFFNLSYAALANNYIPTENLLIREEENTAMKLKKGSDIKTSEEQYAIATDETEPIVQISEGRSIFIQKTLDAWCAQVGYKDSSTNMLTLSHSLNMPKNELTQFFDQCLKTTFRIWLSDIRFHAAKKMMQEYPEYNNDIISVECGFTSRTQLYRLFKTKEGCTPTVWRAKNVEITK